METEKEALSVKLNEEEEKRSKIELSLLAKESDWGEITIEQTAEMERLKRELKAQKQEVHVNHMWQSWVTLLCISISLLHSKLKITLLRSKL